MAVLNPSAAGRQIQTVRTGSQSFANNASTTVTINWPAAFADTNYTVELMLVDETGNGNLGLKAPTATGPAIQSKTAAAVTVTVQNSDAITAHSGHIEAFAIHD